MPDLLPEYFSNNRKKLVKRMKPHSLAVLFPRANVLRTADQFYPFRQDSNIFYLTGLTKPDIGLIILKLDGDEHQTLLFIPRSDEKSEIWTDPVYSVEEAKAISGIESVQTALEFRPNLYKLLAKVKHLYLVIAPPDSDESNIIRSHEGKRLLRDFPFHSPHDLKKVLSELRMVKEGWEVHLIREALRINNETFSGIVKMVKPGVNEKQIEAAIEYFIRKEGAAGSAFHPIVASGSSACILHYNANNQLCREGDLLLLDFGVEYHLYNSDITRTIPISGIYSIRQQELYEIVRETLLFAIQLMKPGATLKNIHSKAVKFMGERLYESGDIKSSDEEERLKQVKNLFMHNIGHHLGLDVHDDSIKEQPFAPGMVLTCEPGIYIREEGTGIRIEEDILITEGEPEILSREIPSDRTDIEKLMMSS